MSNYQKNMSFTFSFLASFSPFSFYHQIRPNHSQHDEAKLEKKQIEKEREEVYKYRVNQ